MVRAQLASKDRERKMHALTRKQLDDERDASRLYRSVGKMFIAEDPVTLVNEMKAKEKETEDEISNLSKKQKVGSLRLLRRFGCMLNTFLLLPVSGETVC